MLIGAPPFETVSAPTNVTEPLFGSESFASNAWIGTCASDKLRRVTESVPATGPAGAVTENPAPLGSPQSSNMGAKIGRPCSGVPPRGREVKFQDARINALS